MNVAQYMASYLKGKGVEKVFMLTGGGAMFLNDALAFEPGMEAVYCHHEQACSMAAEGYARISGMPGVVNVTTGPGGINALNGVFGAFTDSIPMLVLSGQVKRATHLRSAPVPGLRQLGDQEADIAAMAAPVCKLVMSVFDPLQAPAMLAKAWAVCQSGRPGPAWLDIPIDVQSSPIPDELAAAGLAGDLDPAPEEVQGALAGDELAGAARRIAAEIAAAKRPLMLWGSGVRIANVQEVLLEAARALACPVCTAWTHDTLESSDPLHAGRPGTIGTRAGNFALQSCDLLVVLGSRLNVRQTSYNFESFGKNAKVVHVDVDAAEFAKEGAVVDERVHADLKAFAPALALSAVDAAAGADASSHGGWMEWIALRKASYPDMPPAAYVDDGVKGGRINPYAFVDELVNGLPDRAVIATGNASACILPFQCAKLRGSMRLFSNSGSASMGYDIPAAIGAAIADRSRKVVCLAGDGSAQLNIQELETLKRLDLDMKVVILDNEGYLSIKQSQSNFFGRQAGCGPDSGVGFPDYVALAKAYGLPAVAVDGAPGWRERLAVEMGKPGPALIRAMLDPAQGFEPRMSSRKLPDGKIVSPEMEDMHPFLSREELAMAMDVSSCGGREVP